MSEHHVCPSWMAPIFLMPGRRAWEQPYRYLSQLIQPGQTVLDLGCGPGFYTLPMAKAVGPEGTVIACDLQPEMLQHVERRARRAKYKDRIVLHRNESETLNITTPVDFVLAANVIHELPENASFFKEIGTILRPNSRMLVIEPRGHVSPAEWKQTIEKAGKYNLIPIPFEWPRKKLIQCFEKREDHGS